MADLGTTLRGEMAQMRKELCLRMNRTGSDILLQMRILHEEVLDRIKAIPDQRLHIDRRIADGLATIRQEFEPRILVLEAAEKRRRRGSRR